MRLCTSQVDEPFSPWELNTVPQIRKRVELVIVFSRRVPFKKLRDCGIHKTLAHATFDKRPSKVDCPRCDPERNVNRPMDVMIDANSPSGGMKQTGIVKARRNLFTLKSDLQTTRFSV
jgi:hypothetical protein